MDEVKLKGFQVCCGTQLAAVKVEASKEWCSGGREALWRQELLLMKPSSLSKGKNPFNESCIDPCGAHWPLVQQTGKGSTPAVELVCSISLRKLVGVVIVHCLRD